ncbi:hypothetical protein PRIPAC_77827, partial [Pristionchus pacificus]
MAARHKKYGSQGRTYSSPSGAFGINDRPAASKNIYTRPAATTTVSRPWANGQGLPPSPALSKLPQSSESSSRRIETAIRYAQARRTNEVPTRSSVDDPAVRELMGRYSNPPTPDRSITRRNTISRSTVASPARDRSTENIQELLERYRGPRSNTAPRSVGKESTAEREEHPRLASVISVAAADLVKRRRDSDPVVTAAANVYHNPLTSDSTTPTRMDEHSLTSARLSGSNIHVPFQVTTQAVNGSARPDTSASSARRARYIANSYERSRPHLPPIPIAPPHHYTSATAASGGGGGGGRMPIGGGGGSRSGSRSGRLA